MFKLLSLKDKVKVLENCQKLRGSHIYINEDFCQATLQYRKELWKEVERLREEEDQIVYLQYCSIVLKDKMYVNLTSFSCFNKVLPKQNKNDSRHSL